jgi:hypothetical protein
MLWNIRKGSTHSINLFAYEERPPYVQVDRLGQLNSNGSPTGRPSVLFFPLILRLFTPYYAHSPNQLFIKKLNPTNTAATADAKAARLFHFD